MADRTALITGVTGQDGGYLAELLLSKGYTVHGTTRRPVDEAGPRIARLRRDSGRRRGRFVLQRCDLADADKLATLLHLARPDEVYNLAGHSDVTESFAAPRVTAEANAMSALRLLDAIRAIDHDRRIRYFQASSAQIFGNTAGETQDEETPFDPQSPYATAKLYAHWTTVNHRRAMGMHASNGIMFNHESPHRPENFVSRKIARTVAAIALGLERRLAVGNLDVSRDWGHARDFAEAMWLMLQQPEPDDYVLATGESHTVRDFIEAAFACVGTAIEWRGTGPAETGVSVLTGDTLVEIDPAFLRAAEIYRRRGNPARARERLGWEPRTSFAELVREMVEHDLAALERQHGHAGGR